MNSSKHTVLRARARFWYTLVLVLAVTLFALVAVRLAGAAPADAQVEATAMHNTVALQAINIYSPPAESVVGSPMTITGRVDRVPWRNALAYRVFDVAGKPLGVGTFPVTVAPGQPVTFVASISFRSPPEGGPIRLDLFDRDPRISEPIALISLSLYVARPQALTIDSPAAGTWSEGITLIAGNAARLPAQAQLHYTVSASDGRLLGRGAAPVPGSEGRPVLFQVEARFTSPPEGDTVTVTLYDQDPATGSVIASASIPLSVAPQPQRILIDTPGAGVQVGSPVTITGRTVRYPAQGALSYAIFDNRNAHVGFGAFPVAGSLEVGGNFVASIGFVHPPQGGPLRIELYDMAGDGSLRAMTTLNLHVASLVSSSPTPRPVPPAFPTP